MTTHVLIKLTKPKHKGCYCFTTPFHTSISDAMRGIGAEWSGDCWLVDERHFVAALNACIAVFPGQPYLDLDGKVAHLPDAPIPDYSKSDKPAPGPTFQTGESPYTPDYVAQYKLGQQVSFRGKRYFVCSAPGTMADDATLGLGVDADGTGGLLYVGIGSLDMMSNQEANKIIAQLKRERVQAANEQGFGEKLNEFGQGSESAAVVFFDKAVGATPNPGDDEDDDEKDEDEKDEDEGDEDEDTFVEQEEEESEWRVAKDENEVVLTPAEFAQAKSDYEYDAGHNSSWKPRLSDTIRGMVERRPARKPHTSEMPAGLYPHQVEAVKWLDKRGSGLIAYEMGLGKSIIGSVAMTTPAVVLCPASLRSVWLSELTKWRPGAVVKLPEGRTVTNKDVQDADILVVAYNNISHVAPLLFDGVTDLESPHTKLTTTIAKLEVRIAKGRRSKSYRTRNKVYDELIPKLEKLREELASGKVPPPRRAVRAALSKNWSTLLLDESQEVKNCSLDGYGERYVGSKQARIAVEMSHRFERVMLFSGTPIKNRPEEFWSQLHMLDPMYWNSASVFENRFCSPKAAQKVVEQLEKRVARLVKEQKARVAKLDDEELTEGQRARIEEAIKYYAEPLQDEKERLKEVIKRNAANNAHRVVQLNHLVMDPPGTYGLRKRKAEVLKDLPPKTRNSESVLIRGARARKYLAIAIKFLEFILQAKGEEAAARAEANQIITQLTALRAAAAEAKVPLALEWIERRFRETDNPLVVMAHSRKALDDMKDALEANNYRVGVIRGGQSDKSKKTTVDSFQNGSIDVILCSMLAARTGLTLTRSSEVLFIERDWSPANLVQAEDRVHRIGQKRPVTITYLDAIGTIDQKLQALLLKKLATINGALDGIAADEASTTAEIIGALFEGQTSAVVDQKLFSQMTSADVENIEAVVEEDEDLAALLTPRPMRGQDQVPAPRKLPTHKGLEEKIKEKLTTQVVEPELPKIVAEPTIPAEPKPEFVGQEAPQTIFKPEEFKVYSSLLNKGQNELAERLYQAALKRFGQEQGAARPPVAEPPSDPFDTEAQRAAYRKAIAAGRQDLADKLWATCEAARKKSVEATAPADPFVSEAERSAYKRAIDSGNQALADRLWQACEKRSRAVAVPNRSSFRAHHGVSPALAKKIDYVFAGSHYRPNGADAEFMRSYEIARRALRTGLVTTNWLNPFQIDGLSAAFDDGTGDED